jgi:hypothetical protein
MDPNCTQQYPPPPQQFAQPPQGYNYNTQPPPQYYPPSADPLQQGQQNQQNQQYNTNAGYAELGEAPLNVNDKIRPSSGFKDVWATVLWLCNMAGFIALSVIGLRSFSLNKGSAGGGTVPNTGSGITFDADTVRIFGYSAIIGFVFSFLYLILANL